MVSITINDKQKAILKRIVYAEKNVAFQRWHECKDGTERAFANGSSDELVQRLHEVTRDWEDMYEDLAHLMNQLENTDSLEEQLAKTRMKAESRPMDGNEDKQRALSMLVYALHHTRAGADVGAIEVTPDGDAARISTPNSVIDVNIACDSAIAAIIDVCRALM